MKILLISLLAFFCLAQSPYDVHQDDRFQNYVQSDSQLALVDTKTITGIQKDLQIIKYIGGVIAGLLVTIIGAWIKKRLNL